MATHDLHPDKLLTTTRSVRRRLDLDRPVEREVICECLEVAMQAPSGSNTQSWHFVVVTDADQRKALGDIYRRAYEMYRGMPGIYIGSIERDDADLNASQQRSARSADHLAEIIDRVPVHVIPCVAGRTDGQPSFFQTAVWGSIMPATWSFMLAARARGLGSSWTTLHTMFEQEAAEVLGLPYQEISQAALLPVAYYTGDDFQPARRAPLGDVLHWDRW